MNRILRTKLNAYILFATNPVPYLCRAEVWHASHATFVFYIIISMKQKYSRGKCRLRSHLQDEVVGCTRDLVKLAEHLAHALALDVGKEQMCGVLGVVLVDERVQAAQEERLVAELERFDFALSAFISFHWI